MTLNSMRKYVVLLMVLITTGAFGQSKVEWLHNGDDYYALEDYPSALKYYLKTLDDSLILSTRVMPYEVAVTNQKLKNKEIQIDSSTILLKDYLHHQVAMCYYYTSDYNHAVDHFKLSSESGAFQDDKYFYGVALMNVEKHKEALAIFEDYVKQENHTDSLLKLSQWNMSGCYYAMNPENRKEEVVVTMADSVFNSGTAAFAPMWWGSEEKLLFTSARKGGVIFDPVEQQSEFLLDLYWTEKIDSATWGQPHNFGRPLNSAKHDASGCFNNNDVMFFTRWSGADSREQKIYLARMIDLKFFESYPLDSVVNYPGHKSINPFVTLDGSTLYFSSNRPGGHGGMDIWKVQIDAFGKPMGEAENLGPAVNSKYDEVTPFFHETTSTLFFSSNGHKSIGGLDIFKSAFNRDSEYYSAPVNMGMPINSSKDDAYMIWDKYLKKGYFSSDREDCPTGHCYDIYEVQNEPIHIYIEGYVYDAKTDDIIPNATITFKDVEFQFEPFEVTADEEGFYETELSQDIETFIKATKPSYFADAASANTRGITETTFITQDFFLRNIPKEEIEIPGIEYDFDSHKLRKKSEEILDELVEFLNLNDNLVVQINSHTDARGDDLYNLGLSERRAQSCVDYLIGKGIAKERLMSKGFGESSPAFLVDENKDPVIGTDGKKIQLTPEYIKSMPNNTKKEELHQKNRRTAFKVVGEGFKLESK